MRDLNTRLAVVACLCLTVSGCSSDGGDADVRVAQARVDDAKDELAAAKESATVAAADFCDQTADYVVALNRYGGVLTTREVTVGDVRDAGADLADPAEDLSDSTAAAVAARDAVTAAEQDLAEAKTALAQAKGVTPKPTPTSKATQLVPAASSAVLTRVEQAQSDLDAAVGGIADTTPLAEASEQLNAAAVALEMSWLRLLAEVGCLTDEQGAQAEAAVSGYTEGLQQSLALVGRYTDSVDGVYGPATVEAVEGLQEDHGLPVTGTMDRASTAALDDEMAGVGGAAETQAVATAAAVQQTLALAGFWTGPVDGEWTPALTEALQDFQRELGVPPTGAVDAATLAALEQAIADRQAAPEPTEVTTETPSP